MNGLASLPEHVLRLVESSAIAEFATVSAATVPIDTPTYYFPSDDLATLDVATGLAYPAKADRARRNPRVGMLIEGSKDEPVVSIRGRAAVRDSDVAANALRYIAETGFEGISYGLPWSEARKAVWYWTRLIVEIMPERIMWWDRPADMERAPQVWSAPANQVFPASDPGPAGKPSSPAKWPQRDWREIAKDGLARNILPHLTVCDADGYPLPIRTIDCTLVGDRFRCTLPGWLPWKIAGTATLTYIGLETFVGEVETEGNAVWLNVERALPQLPMMLNPQRVLQPTDELRETLLGRLREETARRGQPIPTLPEEPPAPTRLARVRFARFGTSAPTVEGTT